MVCVRVVFVNHLSGDHLGGSELSLLAIIDRWTDRDRSLEPIIVTPAPGAAMEAATRSRGWRTEVMPYTGWAVFDEEGGRAQSVLRARQNRAATARLVEVIEESRPDLVVTNTLVAPWGALAAAHRGVPHVWFVREFGDLAQGFHFPEGRAAALRDIGALSTTVIANSRAVAAELERHMPSHHVTVAYPSVDLHRVRTRSEERPTVQPFDEEAGLRVTVVGRLAPSKGQWRVIDAIALAAQRGVRVDVCFVGEAVHAGDDRILQRRALRRRVSDRVRFVGEQENPFAYMAAADVCVTPSDREAFGRSTLEALAVGRPVIASDSGGSAELVEDGVSGLLFPPDDPEQLALALERLATDERSRTTMAARARARADQIASATLAVDAVLDLLDAARGRTAAVLPERHRAFVADALAPDRDSSESADRMLRLSAEATRWTRRLGRLVRDPRPAVRRRLGR